MASREMPKITVVIPSYQQAGYLETTLRSVVGQGYPDLECFVVDGGSTDGSVDIIKKYADRIDWWVSERDRGQSHAINKGFQRATGQIMCWLNSDDYFAPETLFKVAQIFARPKAPDAIAGDCIRLFDDGRPPRHDRGGPVSLWDLLAYWKAYAMHQPSIFWTREVFARTGLLREDLHLLMDFDYWLRIAARYRFAYIPEVLSYSHFHQRAKTSDDFREYTAQRKAFARRAWAGQSLPTRVALRGAEMFLGLNEGGDR